MKRLVIWLVLILCLLVPSALASEDAQMAEDITQDCTYKSSDRSKLFRLTDGKTEKHYEAQTYQDNWIIIKAPSGKKIGGLSMVWTSGTSEVLLEVRQKESGDFKEFATVNNGVYLHEYIDVGSVEAVRLKSTNRKGTIPINEVTVVTPGEVLPSHVQRWDPPCTDADMLVYVAHPDDEYLFFGGTIPRYAIERKLHVCVAYMTCRNDTRLHELLNGLWTAGVHEYPHLMGFPDKTITSKASSTYKQWGGEDAALDAMAALIDEVKPLVVITQDVNGEDGHGAHRAVADICLRLIRDGERQLAWQPHKLYIHLYEENPIYMDWTTPIEGDGRSSLEIASDAFQCHESQVGFSIKLKNGKRWKFEVIENGMFDNAAFGLAYTDVGPDTGLKDFMENVTPKEH